MHEFAEEYVANLSTREERYDTRLGDDFYVGTFPNGVKTWIYVYDANGYTRRQTLGVYPEMPLERALEALYAARRTRAVENDLMDQGLGGNTTRKAEDSPINLNGKAPRRTFAPRWLDRRFVAGAGTGFVVAAVAAVALSPVLTEQYLFATPVVQTVAGNPAEVVEAPRPASGPTPLPAVAAPEQEAAPVITAEAVTELVADPVTPATEPVEITESQQAVIDLQRNMSGTLAWAQLTSGVADGEPVDDLGWIVELEGESREVFYFVRVRGLAGDEIVYRWKHEGQLVHEDTVRVHGGWHAPAFSSVTLTAARVGRWRVEVVGPDDKQLGVEQFETRLTPTPVLGRR